MTINSSRIKLTLVIGISLLVIGVVYAAITLELWVGASDHIGLWQGPATLTDCTTVLVRYGRTSRNLS